MTLLHRLPNQTSKQPRLLPTFDQLDRARFGLSNDFFAELLERVRREREKGVLVEDRGDSRAESSGGFGFDEVGEEEFGGDG